MASEKKKQLPIELHQQLQTVAARVYYREKERAAFSDSASPRSGDSVDSGVPREPVRLPRQRDGKEMLRQLEDARWRQQQDSWMSTVRFDCLGGGRKRRSSSYPPSRKTAPEWVQTRSGRR